MIRATQVKLNLFYFRCITKVAMLTCPEDYNIFTARKRRKMCTAIQPLFPGLSSSLLSPSRSNPGEGKKRGPWNEFVRHLYPPHTAHYHLPVACHSWKTDAGYYVENISPWWGDSSYFSLWPCWRLRFFLWQWGYSSARKSAMILTSCEQGLNNQTVCNICDDEPDLTPVKTVEIQNETVRNINIVARALIRIRHSKLTYRNQ